VSGPAPPFRPPAPDTGRPRAIPAKPLPCERCRAAPRRPGYRLCQTCLLLQDAARELARPSADVRHLALLDATNRTYDGRRLR
jgi:hypothetical protein